MVDTLEHIAEDEYDYSYVNSIARIALYDDMGAAPRITKIEPKSTNEFIEELTTTIYQQARLLGGGISYTVIREVSENFIHAQFKEIVVSILDNGNTIRFADQGPGIPEKDKAQQPGFSSAIEPMKDYIRGVGSGLPIVRDYLDGKSGTITIEDNIRNGAVVTISLSTPTAEETKKKTFSRKPVPTKPQEFQQAKEKNPPGSYIPIPPLSSRERLFLSVLSSEGALGVKEISELTDTPMSSTYNSLGKLEQFGLVEKFANKKRILTEYGRQVHNLV